MKWLLILMIVLSVAIGIPTNIGLFSLYGFESSVVVGLTKVQLFSKYEIIGMVLPLVAHIVIICLPFLTKNRYFRDLLMIAPPLFMFVYLILGREIAFLLFPLL
jgi:hypothetical protein